MAINFDPFIHPLSRDEFRSKHWPDKIFVSHGNLGRFSELLKIPALQSPEAFIKNWKGTLNAWGPPGLKGCPTLKINAREGLELHRIGFTLYYNMVEREVKELHPILKELEMELGLRTGDMKVEVFLSTPSAGAPMHFDALTSFNIHLMGKKKWWMAPNKNLKNPTFGWGPNDPVPVEFEAYAKLPLPTDIPEDALTFEAGPGAVVFIPEGTWHRTIATENAFSIVFSATPKRWYRWFLEDLEKSITKIEGWRAGAYDLSSQPEDAARHLETLIGELRDLLKETNTSELVSKWSAEFAGRYRVSSDVKMKLEASTKGGSGAKLVIDAAGNHLEKEIDENLAAVINCIMRSPEIFDTHSVVTATEQSLERVQSTLNTLAKSQLIKRI